VQLDSSFVQLLRVEAGVDVAVLEPPQELVVSEGVHVGVVETECRSETLAEQLID
jgi:hypothetical protein